MTSMTETPSMSHDPSFPLSPAEPVSVPAEPAPATDAPSTPVDEPVPGEAAQGEGAVAEFLLHQLAGDSAEEERRFQRAVAVAVAAHIAFFLFTFPEIKREVMFEGPASKVFVMQPTRYKKPQAQEAPAKQEIPEKKSKKIPIPDPTPDDPEPIEIEDFEIPDIEPSDVTEVTFGIPDAPSSTGGQFGTAPFQGDAMQLGDGVSRPVPIFQPEPPYTEDARQRRIQGVVILQGIIDENGEVRNLTVVKGLPFGLDRNTLETVYQWKYKPAVFEGKPVAVHQYFRINFSLQ